MQLVISTWNSININDGTNFEAWFPPGQLVNLTANGVTVPRANAFPFLSTSVLTSHVIILHMKVVTGKDIPTYREILKSYFNIQDTNRHNLIALDIQDSNRPWYLTGIPIRVVEQKAGLYTVTLQIEMPVWKLVTAVTDTWNITASGQTKAVSPLGNVNTKPVLTITPTAGKSAGYVYRRWIPIYNNMDVSYTDAFDVTGGGFDTATLTTAKMQASGNDFRIWVDGQQADRWLSAMDTSATKCWINLSLAPRKEGLTSVSISNSGGITTISFTRTRANLQFLQAMTRVINKIVLIDSEAFIFTGVNLNTYQLTGVTRTQKGTTIATHTAPKTCRWIEHDIWMLYGDASVSAPDVDGDNKPIFELSSTNTVRDYVNFYDVGSSRPGAWKGEVNSTKTGLSYVFTDDENTFVDVSTELGIALVGASSNVQQLSREEGQIDWLYSHSCGVTQVTFSGKKYFFGFGWPAIAGLQALQPDTGWFTLHNENAPRIGMAWEMFGEYVVALGAAYESVRFVLDGAMTPRSGEMALMQFESVTVTLSSGNLPTTSIGSELACNYFDFTLTNTTTGEYIQITLPCSVNDILTMDCEAKQAYTSDGGRVTPIFSTEREAWFDLEPGSNTLQYDDAGTNAVTCVISHRDRTL